MNHEPAANPVNHLGNRIRFSIVLKLNTKLLRRLLSVFLTLDLFLCLLFAAGLAVRAEQIAGEAAVVLSETGLPSQYEKNWVNLSGCSVRLQTEKLQGFEVPSILQPYVSKLTAAGLRRIDMPRMKGIPFWNWLQGAVYCVSANIKGNAYLISVQGASSIRIFEWIFLLLLVQELFMLIAAASKGAKIIRETLRPIQELAETAQTLNTQGTFTPEQLEALAGKLDDINATKLDTRISVGDTQNELKTLASAINGMLDRINESYRSQVRFVSDASHELRTPISVIQGYANLLDRWGKNDEKTLQESIDAIKDETDNMKGLVEQLLFLARGDNNTMALQMEPLDLSALAAEVLRETQMIDSGHEYSSNISPATVDADSGLIKQAMRILIDNAIKYTPSGKRIAVSVSATNEFATLSVQDEGIGIPPEAVPQIFNRFFRADESRARATGGTGLGLSIAKWITERHGGHMEVLSREDIGTRISIVLPALQVSSQPDI